MNLDLIVRTSAILLIAWSVAALLRRAAPSTRHLVWHISIVVVLLAPAIMALGLKVPIVPGVPGVPEVPKVVFQAVPSVPAVQRPHQPWNAELLERSGTQPWNYWNVGTLEPWIAWLVLVLLAAKRPIGRRGSRPAPEVGTMKLASFAAASD
jgi:hypothetical protein